MASPPQSSGLFLSSSPCDYPGNYAAAEVVNLITQARKTVRLDQTIERYVALYRASFLAVFGRHIELIKSRSHAFEDCQITVYDKVLLALTNDGNELENPAAITYFCEEHLGINLNAGEREKAQNLSSAVDVSFDLTQANSPPDTVGARATPTEQDPNFSSLPNRKKYIFPAEDGAQEAMTLAALAVSVNPKLAPLWNVYEKAKADYLAVADLNNDKTASAARFLRDTAENTLQYIDDSKSCVDDRVTAELYHTFNTAKDMVVHMTGGKNRKFDRPEVKKRKDYDPQYNPRCNPRKKRQRHQEEQRSISSPRVHTRYTSHSSYREFPDRAHGATYPLAHHREPEYYAEHDEYHGDDEEYQDSKHKRPAPGRGHSGFPFGYSRRVDSYHPR